MKRVWIILGLLLLLAGCQSEEGTHHRAFHGGGGRT
ncbi:lipoprotein [Candidatus Woesearchaeota archaeon]|nr:lipoprotein [Candidatus Woesearchaeota archaeon]